MNKRTVENTLAQQRKLIEKLLDERCLTRYAAKYISEESLMQIIRGVRSSGKTFTAVHRVNGFEGGFAYVDLSQGLFALKTDEVGELVESLLMVYGPFQRVILDEFTVLDNWREVFHTLVSLGYKVIGISSRVEDFEECISEENSHIEAIPTISFYPLSFSEYCLWHDVATEGTNAEQTVALRKAFDDYLFRGGFPQLQWKKRTTKTVQTIENAILSNDIRGDFRKNRMPEVMAMAQMVLETSTEIINYREIAQKLGIGSEVTAKKYLEAIKGSGMLYTLERFYTFEKMRNVFEKAYVADVSLVRSDDLQRRLETVVFNQLHRFCERHGYQMYYYANRSAECNFVVCSQNKMRTTLQVMADYSDSAAVKEKVSGLIAMAKASGCDRLFILTDAERDVIEAKGLHITVAPVYEFLTDRSHKIVSN